MNKPFESKFLDCVRGLKILKYGAASVPVELLHCHPPLFEEKSPSIKFSIKKASPNLQS